MSPSDELRACNNRGDKSKSVFYHSAEKGSNSRDVDRLHRIDPILVKQEIESAGFEFITESNALNNTEDMLNTMVMMPLVKGKSDRFIYKFRKPE